MKLHVKALLLSAFILPGLGQIFKGERLKGIILILLVNIFLLSALFLILQNLGPVIVAAQLSGSVDPTILMEHLSSRAHVARWLLMAFFGVWVYGTVDAAVHPCPPTDES